MSEVTRLNLFRLRFIVCSFDQFFTVLSPSCAKRRRAHEQRR
jgi:hypothetical protein